MEDTKDTQSVDSAVDNGAPYVRSAAQWARLSNIRRHRTNKGLRIVDMAERVRRNQYIGSQERESGMLQHFEAELQLMQQSDPEMRRVLLGDHGLSIAELKELVVIQRQRLQAAIGTPMEDRCAVLHNEYARTARLLRNPS